MDIHILAQVILYYCMVVAGLAVSITTGVNRHIIGKPPSIMNFIPVRQLGRSIQGRFNGMCILYGSFNDMRILEGSAAATCDYPIYVSVIGMVIYGVLMGAYYSYCLHKSRRDPNIGFQMWVMPTLLLNGVLFIFFLVAACIVSVGYAIFCNNYLEGLPSGVKCSIGENREWLLVGTDTKFNPGNYVTFMNSCMIFAWLGVLFIILQIALGFLRVYRTRHKGPTRSASVKEENPQY